jgi:hypothetical protein
MLSFVVLAKKKIGPKPVIKFINKHRLSFGHAPLHFASVQQDFSESVNQPLQLYYTKGRDLCAHVELGAKGTHPLEQNSAFIFVLVTI